MQLQLMLVVYEFVAALFLTAVTVLAVVWCLSILTTFYRLRKELMSNVGHGPHRRNSAKRRR